VERAGQFLDVLANQIELALLAVAYYFEMGQMRAVNLANGSPIFRCSPFGSTVPLGQIKWLKLNGILY
jgi:hypothetical protein